MRSVALSLLVVTLPVTAWAQESPAPGAEPAVLQPTPLETPAEPAPATPAPAAAVQPVTGYDGQCWAVTRPVTDPAPMMPEGEFEAYVVQAGFGALTRRAVYNAEGMDARLVDVGARQDELLMDLRVKKVAAPLVMGAVGVALGVVLGVAGAGSAVLFLVSGVRNLPLANNDTRPGSYLLYALLVTAVAGLPLAILAVGGGIIPLVFSGLLATRLGSVPSSPLLDQTGFTANEASEMAATHNQRLAKKLGMQGVQACTAR